MSYDEQQLAAWQEWCEAPWGRLRFAVVEETLRRQTEALGGGALRVLDVGGGDGRDALPLAQAGHHVTILDPAEVFLADAVRRAEAAGVSDRVNTVVGSVADLASYDEWRGAFDLVLFHFVTHYRPADTDDLAQLVQTLRPRGRLSVMAPNADTRVIMTLTRQGPQAALDELRREDMTSHTFGTTTRKVTFEDMARDVEALGLEVVGRFAARVANDYVTDDDAKRDPDYFEALRELEVALCDREPYVRLGGMWQLVAETAGGRR